MKTKRILIATGIYPPDIGGPATMIEAMTNALQERGYKCSVLAYGDKNARLRGGKDTLPFVVTRIGKHLRSPFRQAVFLTNLLRMAKKADLMYVTDTYSVGLSCLIAKKLFGTPYILRFAGDSAWELASTSGKITDDLETFQHKKYSFDIEARKALRKQIMCGANHVIAVSAFMMKIADLIGVEAGKCSLIYNSVDFLSEHNEELVTATQISQLRKNLPENTLIIGTACRLTVWKGVDLLIKALAILKKNSLNIHLVVMGDGPERENLEQMACRYDVQQQVHFLGRIPQNEMAAHLHALDVFVLCSLYEGLSHTILQAMQARTPVVASSVGGNIELVESGITGLLVPPQNEIALADALHKITTRADLRRQFAGMATAKLDKFSWTTTVDSTCRIIRDIFNCSL